MTAEAAADGATTTWSFGVATRDEAEHERLVREARLALWEEHGYEEIVAAVTEVNCRVDAGSDATYIAVRAGYEEDFLRSHGAELEAWMPASPEARPEAGRG